LAAEDLQAFAFSTDFHNSFERHPSRKPFPSANLKPTVSTLPSQQQLAFFMLKSCTRGTSVKPKRKFTVVARGRILLAVERYKQGEASLSKAAELAGLPVGQMITILAEFGVESRIEKEDYLQGLHNLAKVW